MFLHTRSFRWIVCYAFVWLFLSLPLSAQQTLKSFQEQFPSLKRVDRFENYSTNHGISNSSCRSNLLIDKQGFLWIGTVDGLSRFDGYRFEIFRNDPTDSNSLSGNLIYALFEDSWGDIWVGTNSAGLNRYSKNERKFYHYYHDPFDSTSLSDNTIASIYQDRNNNLWVGTPNGLNRLRLSSGSRDNTRFVRYTHQPNNPRSLGYKGAGWFKEEPSGSLLVGVWQGGLYDDATVGVDRYDQSIDGFTHYATDPRIPPSLHVKKLRRVMEDSKGMLWITTAEEVYQYDRRSSKLSMIWHRDKGQNFLLPYTLPYEDSHGVIWLIHVQGILSIIPNPLRVVEYRNNAGIQASQIEDRAGNMWFSTDHGLDKLSRNAMQFSYLFPEGDTTKRFWVNIEDRSGALWGSRGLTLKRFQPDKQVPYASVDSFRLQRPSRDICDWDDEVVWVATWGAGLCEVSKRTGKVSYYKRNPKSNDPLWDNVVISLCRDSSQTLWLATTEAGLCKFDVAKRKYVKEYRHDSTNPYSISTDRTWVVMRDKQGFVWIGTEGGGLNRFDPSTERFEHWKHNRKDTNSISSDHVYVLNEDSEDNIWVGTNNGLNKFNRENGTFKRFLRGTASSESVQTIAEGDHKTIWVGYRSDEVSRLDPQTGSFKTYSMKSGLSHKGIGRSCYKGRRTTGEFVFNGGGGMLVFYPDSLRENTVPPSLALTEFFVFDKSIKLYGSADAYAAATLPFDSNFISCKFVALDFTDPGSNQYAYKLEGYEDNWNYVGNKREANYTKVPPGEYVFRVKGTNSDGVWNEKGTFVNITITPPWWKTVWAYGSYGVLLIAGLYSFRRNEKKRDRMKQQAELERVESEKRLQQEFSKQLIETQEAERKRVASELHDSLGQQLLIVNNELQLYQQGKGQNDPDIQRTNSIVKDAIKEVREIASNLHPHHLEKLGLRAAVEAMIEQISRSTPVQFDAAIEDVDDKLSMEAKINLYRVLQEAIANLVRHSGATHARITISQAENAVHTTIEDNGKGFTPGASHGGRQGFGLRSMTERMRLINGTITFDSTPGNGTKIKIIIPC